MKKFAFAFFSLVLSLVNISVAADETSRFFLNADTLPAMDELVIMDFFDERGSLSIPVNEFESWGDVQGVLIGRVFLESDKEPLVGALITINEKPLRETKSDESGKFYLPIKKLPAIIEISFIGCEKFRFKVNKKNIKKFQNFYLQECKNAIRCY